MASIFMGVLGRLDPIIASWDFPKKIVINKDFQDSFTFLRCLPPPPRGAPVAASIRFFQENIPGNHQFEDPAWRPYGALSLPQHDHCATLVGLAAPIRSARMRARTVMFKYSSDFYASGLNPTDSRPF
ncbi:MAG: hypothetical protein CVV32_06805 [Methanomicrobiales archaeon HGW-Methanomicrobiales-3]|nr:MAG: hypothetical protein CVV32_06805 [Methanomicrobiales archaeon HGW-Methanomicrobiales-3]